jgi:hypothetical protein
MVDVSRTRHYAWRLAPLLLMLALYCRGSPTGFIRTTSAGSTCAAISTRSATSCRRFSLPKAHGNMRPLGENTSFPALSSLFGVNALPFRICAVRHTNGKPAAARQRDQ